MAKNKNLYDKMSSRYSLYRNDVKITVSLSKISHHSINSQIYDYEIDKKRMMELAESIERDGLQQPLVVKKDPDQEGHYICLIGHRRLEALKYLVNEKKIKGYAIIECLLKEFKDEEQEIVYMIASNATQRKLTDDELLRQYRYYKNNIDDIRDELGDEAKGVRTVEIIQEQTGLGLATIRKLNVADKILTGKFKELFERQLLDLKDVDVMNSFNKFQLHEFKSYVDGNSNLSVKEIKGKLKDLKESGDVNHKKTKTVDKAKEGEAIVKMVTKALQNYLKRVDLDSEESKLEMEKVLQTVKGFIKQMEGK